MTDGWRHSAVELIRDQSTLTLATADASGPWSAPVYFVFSDDSFYFFSSPRSRHIQQAELSGQAAASLFADMDSWQAIRGLQMEGSIERVRSISISLGVIAVYLARFPFTRDFFPGNPTPDLEAFFTCFKARLYEFSPKQVFYIDNRNGLGKRRLIDW
jgi:uncharacterized protein YhbP (UPF0306 family)